MKRQRISRGSVFATVATVVVVVAIGGCFLHEERMRTRELKLAELFSQIGKEIVFAAMSPREAIVYARETSGVVVSTGIDQYDRDPDAFPNGDLPEEFDKSSSISFSTELPSLRPYGRGVFCEVRFENGVAMEWYVGGSFNLVSPDWSYSGSRRRLPK